MKYEPKPGSGWEEGASPLEGVRRWRAPIGSGMHLSVSFENEYGVIARVRYGASPEHQVPRPEDLGRIERDFGVRGWRILGVSPVASPSVGQCLLAKAVDPAREN